jgi:hypothetical protein
VRYYYASTEDAVFNTTKMIKNVSEHMEVCTDMFYQFYNHTVENYEQFASGGDYGLAFMQNLLANIININTIYQSIQLDTTETFN